MTLHAPTLAARVQPGQFIHLRLGDCAAYILRRPLSVFNADAEAGELQLLYQVVGEGTAQLSALDSSACLDAIGPIGRGWQPPVAARRVLLVGGGVGSAPLHLLAAQLSAGERGGHAAQLSAGTSVGAGGHAAQLSAGTSVGAGGRAAASGASP